MEGERKGWTPEALQKWEEIKLRRSKPPRLVNRQYLTPTTEERSPMTERGLGLEAGTYRLHEFSGEVPQNTDLMAKVDIDPLLTCHRVGQNPLPPNSQARVFLAKGHFGLNSRHKKYCVPEAAFLQQRLQKDITTSLNHHFRDVLEEDIPEVVGTEEMQKAMSRLHLDFEKQLKKREEGDKQASLCLKKNRQLLVSEDRLKKDPVEYELKRRVGISKKMLAKRGPDVKKPMTAVERKRKQRKQQKEEKNACLVRMVREKEKKEKDEVSEPCWKVISGQPSEPDTQSQSKEPTVAHHK